MKVVVAANMPERSGSTETSVQPAPTPNPAAKRSGGARRGDGGN